MKETVLPKEILKTVKNKPYRKIGLGRSGAEVREYDDCVLKIRPRSPASANEAIFADFLKGR